MTYTNRSEKLGVGHLFVPRPAKPLLPHARSLRAAIVAVFRRIPRPQRKTAEERLEAQARREAHRRYVDALWIKHRRQVDDLWVNRQIY